MLRACCEVPAVTVHLLNHHSLSSDGLFAIGIVMIGDDQIVLFHAYGSQDTERKELDKLRQGEELPSRAK
jgi:hypothetical protein